MNIKQVTGILIATFFQSLLLGQTDTYTVKKAAFSSDLYDEFSPVYYNNGIVYCSNRSYTLLNRSTSQNKGLFKIFFIDTAINAEWKNAKLFSKNLTTAFNDGPVTFNKGRDTIYYSRNLDVTSKLGDISNQRNKLGIFYAEIIAGQWTKIRELRINNEWYNVTTPCLSPDGKRIYFASDKSGGYGGSDLYYSQWKNGYWGDPVNLGPKINTKGNEAYPFLTPTGEMLFSSDGHPGLGGKDIFFSRISDTAWLPPVHLNAPINSKFDDFGIATDALINEGYFSSNRGKSIDIFHFQTIFPQIFYSIGQKENQYCFTFNDNGNIAIDTLNLRYVWTFGDGKKYIGPVATHCLPGPGNYAVKLDIIEKSSGNLFFSKLFYNLEIKDYQQPYINSPGMAVKGQLIEFDGLKSYLPGDEILNYLWDFGDGNKATGESVTHIYKNVGKYEINLELTFRSKTDGTTSRTGVSKKIRIFNSQQELGSYHINNDSIRAAIPDIRNYKNAYIKTQYSAESESQKDVVFNIEVLSSKKKLGINNKIFSNIPKKYTLKEKFTQNDSTYRYILDQQMNLMATYPAYKELADLGYKGAHINIVVLNEPYEKELHNLIKINGANVDSYFDNNDKLTSNAYIMLDQIVKLLKKYPALRLEVAVHSDNTGPAETSLALSQSRSQLLVNYLISRGINAYRLVATGFGGSKPIAPNYFEKDRKLNRRIDFIILN
jgi:outer membrane protein OmpA-like peptidoglycan-associated protein